MGLWSEPSHKVIKITYFTLTPRDAGLAEPAIKAGSVACFGEG